MEGFRVTGALEHAWRGLEARTDALQDAARKVALAADRAASATRQGNTVGLAKAIQSLSENAEEVRTTLVDVDALMSALVNLLRSEEQLLQEIEFDLRAGGSSNVLRSMNVLITYPTRVAVRGSGTAMKVTVDMVSVPSQRPSRIVEAISAAAKNETAPDRFAKSLHAAFRAMKGESETGTVSLTSLYRVLAANPPGVDAYTLSDFTVDVQRLLASRISSVSNSIRFSFEVASAGPTAIPIYEPDGDRINIGYIKFSSATVVDG